MSTNIQRGMVIYLIYLDNAATTKVSQQVLDAMLPYFTQEYGNAGSVHSMGEQAAKAIRNAREQVATPINADPYNIIFTSGGSEANTLAIMGLAKYLKSIGKNHIITTKVEHHSVLECMKCMFHNGFYVTYLPVDKYGNLNLELLSAGICERTGLVSVMTVNNETGNLYPIHEIGEICHQNNVLFHTDCVQGYCQVNVDVGKDHIDFLSASGHKIHAPKGIGFLYAKDKTLLEPVIKGGGQEYGLRGGTENTPYIVGMGIAARTAHEKTELTKIGNRIIMMKFLTILSEKIGYMKVNGQRYSGSKTVNLQFDDVDGETLLLLLDGRGVAVSAGSACSAHSAVPSHVLTALGLTDKQARASIRVSLSEETTCEEVCEAANIIADSVNILRRK